MGAILALDYGLRRVGVAVSDPTRTLATALGAHDSRTDGSLFAWLGALVVERGIDRVLVGLPLTADGAEGEIARKARGFAAKLEEALGLPVELVDERYSSQEADRWLADSSRRREKGQRDAVAAELILQQYLDGPAGGRS
jgi:putative Holliday junction resolvase